MNYLKIKNQNCVQGGEPCYCDKSEYTDHEEDHCGDCRAYAMEGLHEYKKENPHTSYDFRFNKTIDDYQEAQ